MKKKFIMISMLAMLLVSTMIANAIAISSSVKVSLPSFPVSINGIQVENDYRQYPLILYRNITYFPMTYYDCRFLGTETKWDSKTGLEIDQTGVTAAYKDYNGKIKNKNAYTAAIASFDVKVNGKTIHNTTEEYPLLVFRNVTYFPLTWKFGVGEFGWTFNFDAKDGLIIQSSNPKLEKKTLSGYTGGNAIAIDGYYYYGGAKGVIYQAPITNLDNTKKIYQLPTLNDEDGNTYVLYSLTKNNNEAWLIYRQGGASMGSDYYIKLNQDGTYEEIASGNLTFKTFGDITVKVNQWSPPSPGNLMVKYDGQKYKRVGDAAYLFGFAWEKTETSSGGSPSGDLYLIDHNLYLLACDMGKGTDESRIYRVNIDTNETSRVSDLKTKSFIIDAGYIYCISEGNLYKIPVAGGPETSLEIIGSVSNEFGLQALNGMAFYVNSLNNELYKVGTALSLNPGAKVTGMKLEDGYLVCTFQEETNHSYRMMIVDQSGKIVFKTSDIMDINNISIGKGKLSYVENTDNSVYITDFPQ